MQPPVEFGRFPTIRSAGVIGFFVQLGFVFLSAPVDCRVIHRYATFGEYLLQFPVRDAVSAVQADGPQDDFARVVPAGEDALGFQRCAHQYLREADRVRMPNAATREASTVQQQPDSALFGHDRADAGLAAGRLTGDAGQPRRHVRGQAPLGVRPLLDPPQVAVLNDPVQPLGAAGLDTGG